jgi:hypothetical protein
MVSGDLRRAKLLFDNNVMERELIEEWSLERNGGGGVITPASA